MNKYEIRRLNLIQIIKERAGGSYARFSEMTGKDPSYISRMCYPEGKKGKKRIAEDMRDDIETALRLPKGSLDAAISPIPAQLNSIQLHRGLDQSAYSLDQIGVPLLANAGSMGDGSAVMEGDIVVGTLSISREWASKYLPSVKRPDSLRFIHGYGDSMHPTFNDGDVLLVDTAVRDPSVDGIYVLTVHGQLYIKRISRRFDGKHEISSDNPSVKTVEVMNGNHEVEIKGRVVWCWNGKKI